jgi:tetratricopeptide (TPR) repeat protein
VEPVSIIVGALGACTGVVADEATKDAYSWLKRSVGRVLARAKPGDTGRTELAGDTDASPERIGALLVSAGADQHPELLAAAQQVWLLVDPDGTAKGRYRVKPLATPPTIGPPGTYQFVADAQPTWPVLLGVVPPLADCFQERHELKVLADPGLLTGVTFVLAGLGGIGKSQLAAAYAHRRKRSVDLLMWVGSANREKIAARYAEAAKRLGYPRSGESTEAAEWFVNWLSTTKDRVWLVVLDDLTDPEDVRELWPCGPRGTVVVTTRRKDTILSEQGRRLVEIDLFTPDAATRYLRARLREVPVPRCTAEAPALAADLGNLPLALAQAAAFIIDRRESCAAYRRRLEDGRQRLLKLFPRVAFAGGYPTTVAATWSVSVDEADKERPTGISRPLLEFLGMLDPDGAPKALVTTPACIDYVGGRRAVARPAASPDEGDAAEDDDLDADTCEDALHNLVRLSLVAVDPTGGPAELRVHGLVQRAALEHLAGLDRQKVRDLARNVADALLDVWPEVEPDASWGSTLRANVAAVRKRAGDALWQPRIHPILWRAGRSLRDVGLFDAAESYWTSLESEATQHLGPRDRATLTIRANIAHARGQRGRPHEAITAFEEVLRDYHTIGLKADHRYCLVARQELAHWHGEAGDPATAVTGTEQVLADRERELGADHPATVESRAELAHWTGQAGKPSAAAASYEVLLVDLTGRLGPQHPTVLLVRHEIARWRGEAGDVREAAARFDELLPDCVRVFGPASPYTLSTRMGRARWHGEAGDPDAAISGLTALLPECESVLGPDHPLTLSVRHERTRWRGEAGHCSSAVEEFELLYLDRQRVLGDGSPYTLSTRSNAARWRGESGDVRRAVAEFEELVSHYLAVLGGDHPDTLTARANLAQWRMSAGDAAAALAELETLLADRTRVLGDRHRHTLSTRASLADSRRVTGDPGAAAVDLRMLVQDCRRVLGPDHLDTLAVRARLADCLGETEQASAAVAAFEELTADYLDSVGPGHRDTRSCQARLALWRRQVAESCRPPTAHSD